MTLQHFKIASIALGITALTIGGVTASAHGPSLGRGSGGQSLMRSVRVEIEDLFGETSVPAGTIDDGKDLVPLATVSLEAAIATAQTAGPGDVGEVDLEYMGGRLVYNVDIGDLDVKVDASTGVVVDSSID